MFNLLWGIAFVIVNFLLFLICSRWFGKKGLFAWVGAATLMANIQVVKTIEVGLLGVGIVTTLGNTIYTTISMSVDLLNEKFGQKAARQAVWFGFFILLTSTILMQMVLLFEPQETDIAQSSMETLFGLMPRLAAGSLCAYLISQYLDVALFTRIRQRFSKPNQLWIRTTGSTVISQFVDSLIFCSIAFIGLYEWEVWLQILITTYLFKFIIALLATPVLYAARRFRLENDDN